MHKSQCITNNLRLLAFNKDANLSKISRDTGISRNTLTAIYRNRSKYISFEVLGKLCAYFDCGISDFLVLANGPEKRQQPVA